MQRADLPPAVPAEASGHRGRAGVASRVVLDPRRDAVLALHEALFRALHERSSGDLRPLLAETVTGVGREGVGSSALAQPREVLLAWMDQLLQGLEPQGSFAEAYLPPRRVLPLAGFLDGSAPPAMRAGDWYVEGPSPRMLRGAGLPGGPAGLPATLEFLVRFGPEGPRVVALTDALVRPRN